ncbi:MAG TPA: ThuA domain-containing protein [Dongiaceae bacterium]|nr:ThuA domain-containing protein [Dongiaceae bacterium]
MKPAVSACAMTRREMIRRTSMVAAGVGLAGYVWPLNAASAKTKKVLFFSKSSGYEHSVIKRNRTELSFAEKILAGLGPKNGIEFTFSKDGSLFSPEYVAQFDAFCFYTLDSPLVVGTDGFPAMTPAGKAALLDAVKNGKGFIGVHSASDTFHSNAGEDGKTKEHLSRYKNYGAQADDYTKMLGGEFIAHSTKQQKAKLRVTDGKFPGLQNAGAEIELMEEWYSLKEFADDLHVILVQETAGMDGAPYQRPDYPSTWTRMHGQGRVFYTAMGHREDVWTNPLFQEILFGGIAWAVRNVDADVTPNLKKVTPSCDELPPVTATKPAEIKTS